MKHTFLVLFVFTINLASTQSKTTTSHRDNNPSVLEQRLSTLEMESDIDDVVSSIKKVHPMPFDRCSEKVFNAACVEAREAVRAPLTVLEFSSVVSVLMNTLGDSHTALNPRDLLFMSGKTRRIYPFYLTQIQDKFYLTKVLNDRIPKGVEVIKVNNQRVKELFEITSKYAPSEGPSIKARDEVTSMMMGLVFNLKNRTPDKPVLMTFVSHQGDTMKSDLVSMRSSKYLNKNNSWHEKRNLEFKFDDTTAFIGLNSFDARRERSYMRGIDIFFRRIERKKIKKITIDIRGNRGGYVLLLEHVLSYINTNNATFDLNYLYKRSELDRFETLSRLKKMDFVKKALRVYPKGMISKEYDFYKSNMGTTTSILYQKKLRNSNSRTFTGECTLLTNGLSMSASVLMASWFKSNERGEIIGSPCFGSMKGTHGNPGQVILKNSGIPISISTLKLNTLVGTGDVEITPDISVKVSAENVKHNTDPFDISY